MYWYFVSSNTSSFVIEATPDIGFLVEVSGKFNNEYLPLADKIIRKSIVCRKSCNIGPLPPAIYDIVLTASGFEILNLVRSIQRWESVREKVIFHPELRITAVSEGISESSLEDEAMIENMKVKNPDSDIHALTRKGEKLFVEIRSNSMRSVGIIKNDVFNQIYQFKDLSADGYLDQTKSVYIIPTGSTDTLIFLETREVVSIPHFDTLLLARKENNSLIITTQSGSLEKVQSGFRSNPRYTDWIDIDARYRLGYIDAADQAKLSLQNYPLNIGILLVLDRSTGVSTILRTPFILSGFLRIGEKIGYIDRAGNQFILENITPDR